MAKKSDFYKNKTILFDKTIEKEFYCQIARNIKNIRTEKGISLFELALGIGHQSTSFIHAAELCKDRHYNLATLKKISLFLDVPIIDFFQEN